MTQLTEPFTSPPAPETAPRRLSGTRRAIASVLLTAGLLAVGGTAVALAADPSASPAPSTSTQPSNGGTGAPSTGTPSTGDPAGRGGHANGKDCPNMGGSGRLGRLRRLAGLARDARHADHPQRQRFSERLTPRRRPVPAGRRLIPSVGLLIPVAR